MKKDFPYCAYVCFKNGLNKLKKDLGIESRKGKGNNDSNDAETALNNYIMNNDGKICRRQNALVASRCVIVRSIGWLWLAG